MRSQFKALHLQGALLCLRSHSSKYIVHRHRCFHLLCLIRPDSVGSVAHVKDSARCKKKGNTKDRNLTEFVIFISQKFPVFFKEA